MNSRRDRGDMPDELDRLLSRTLHDVVRHAEPPARVWQNVSAALAHPAAQPAAGAPASDRNRLIVALGTLGWLIGRILAWPVAAGGQRAMPVVAHNVGFADIGFGSSSMVWWNQAYDSAVGQPGSIWQACAIAS